MKAKMEVGVAANVGVENVDAVVAAAAATPRNRALLARTAKAVTAVMPNATTDRV